LIKKKSRTIIGLDVSINGTGFTVISNDPSKKSSRITHQISNSKFFILEAGVVSGARVSKVEKTAYTLGVWTPKKIVEQPTMEGVPLYLRAHTVFHQFIKPLLAHNPDMIVIEGYSFGSKGRVFDIAEFTGSLKYLIELQYLESGLKAPFVVIPPTNLKLYTTGKGQADKDVIEANLKKKYNIDLFDNNIADSFSLAIMAAELGDALVEFSKNGTFEELKKYKKKMSEAS